MQLLSPYLCDFGMRSLIREDLLNFECSLSDEKRMRIGYSNSGQSQECSLNDEEPIGSFSSQERKWSDWLRVICFVFKIVVPKHRLCKLQTFETFVSLEAITPVGTFLKLLEKLREKTGESSQHFKRSHFKKLHSAAFLKEMF